MGFWDRLFGRTSAKNLLLSAREQNKPLETSFQPRKRSSSGPCNPPEKDWDAPVFLVGNIQGVGNREEQEDSFAVFNCADERLQKSQGLFAVAADGMGGMADGKAASECAVDVFRELFFSRKDDLPVPDWLYSSACAASDQVFRQFSGASGTTLTAVHILGKRLYWLSVGDSAIFLKRGGGVFQLNREHTYLNQLYEAELEEEFIDKNRAQQNEDARRLTSFVGIDHLKEVDLNLQPWVLQRNDVILLCSDGISGVLTPPELLEAMSLDPDEGCALLETMILEKKNPAQDNYTGIMIACR